MVSEKSCVKIIGLREVVSDLLHCPPGFHHEVWSEIDGDAVRVWTSEYLSQNCWTTGHPETERELTGTIRGIRDDASWDGKNISMTEAVRRAVAKVWGVSVSNPSEVSGVKTIRRSGSSLTVSVSDLAGIIGAEQGDAVKVTISFVE